MCGRFVLDATPAEVIKSFDLEEVEDFPPRFNIAPTQPILVVRHREVPKGSNRPPREALHARWGLVPSWVKDPRDFPLLINARSETAETKASFRAAMKRGRILVPASGFYEWQKLPGGAKQPFWVRPRGGGMVAFAGLLEEAELRTAAIMTVDAAGPFREIHERMPVVVERNDFDRWLDPSVAPAAVRDIPRTPDDAFWEAIPVSDAVNKVRNQGPELIEPDDSVTDGPPPKREDATLDEPAQGSLF